MAGALLLSYERLKPDERRLLTLLASLPPGRVDTVLVAELAGFTVDTTLRVLDSLCDAYLVRWCAGGQVELLRLPRELLAQREVPKLNVVSREAATKRFFELAIAKAATADAALEPDRYRVSTLERTTAFASSDEALVWLRAQWPFLAALCRLALEQGRMESCWALAQLLRGFFGRERLLEPWVRTHRHALEAARSAGDQRGMAITLNNLGMAHLERGELQQAAACHREAIDHYEYIRDDRGVTDSMASLAWIGIYKGDARQALQGLTTARDRYEHDGRVRSEMITLRGMALAAVELDRQVEAMDYAADAQRLARTPRDELLAANCLGWVHFRSGQFDDAKTCYDEALGLGKRDSEHAELARAMTGMGNVAAVRGAWLDADEWWSSVDRQPVRLNPLVGEVGVRLRFAGPGSSSEAMPS